MSKILDPVALWQDLHQIPELAMQEVKTSAYVAKTLEDLGIPVTRNVGGTGVVGYIRGEEPGPVLMLRADMDALPFTIDGKECAIHACGHDSHTAITQAPINTFRFISRNYSLKYSAIPIKFRSNKYIWLAIKVKKSPQCALRCKSNPSFAT